MIPETPPPHQSPPAPTPSRPQTYISHLPGLY